MYPVNTEYTSGADAWTWDARLKAAEACRKKAGMPFALGLSNAGRLRRFLRRIVRFVPRGTDRCEGQHYCALRPLAAGPGIRAATGKIPAAQHAEL